MKVTTSKNKDKNKEQKKQVPKKNEGGIDFFGNLWKESWTYIKTVVDIVQEPVLVLDRNLCIIEANESFYKTFQVKKKDTENKVIYEIGNGQWNIPSLRKLLDEILPKHTFLKGFEVTHDFPIIGYKVMMLNARQIHFTKNKDERDIILLAIEDITEMMGVAEMLAHHTREFEERMTEKTEKLSGHIKKLEEEINRLKKLKKD